MGAFGIVCVVGSLIVLAIATKTQTQGLAHFQAAVGALDEAKRVAAERFEALVLVPGDILVAHHPLPLSPYATERIQTQLSAALPNGVRCLLLQEGMRLQAVNFPWGGKPVEEPADA